MVINDICLEIRNILKSDDIDETLLDSKVNLLLKTIEEEEWYSRKIDEIDYPSSELIKKKYYDYALKILFLLKDKEYCSYDMAPVDYEIGVCYFELKNYEKAYQYFIKAISDDEDFDEAYEYIHKIREIKGEDFE